jgi:hypothetical protein
MFFVKLLFGPAAPRPGRAHPHLPPGKAGSPRRHGGHGGGRLVGGADWWGRTAVAAAESEGLGAWEAG